MLRSPAWLALGSALALTLTACSAAPTATPNPAPAAPNASSPAAGTDAPIAIATTTTLGSVLSDIATCGGATSATVMGPGDDPHAFALSSDQVANMTKAKLVVANGLGLEGGMKSSLENVKRDGGHVFEVAPSIDPLPFNHDHDHEGEHGHEHEGEEGHDHKGEEDHDGHDHGEFDPHFWLDASRMAKAARNIGAELTKATGDAKFRECGEQVGAELDGVHTQVKQTLAAVPAERRVIISDHHAFGYFAKAYDFKVAGVVIPGGSTDAEPSSADLAKITSVIAEQKVPAIFSNTAVNDKLVQAVAKEVGSQVKVVPLFVGSVGPQGSNAETYATMMKTNATLIADALK